MITVDMWRAFAEGSGGLFTLLS